MFKRIGLALLLTLWSSLTFAQGNVTCATRPIGDISNACASTAFVSNSGSIFPPATPVTRTTLQAAINAAEAAHGGTVQIPPGSWFIDTTAGCLSITSGVQIRGAGASLDGISGTTLTKTNAANDLFCVNTTTLGQIGFSNFGVSASIAQNSGTAGIHIIAATSFTPILIQNTMINAMYNSVMIDNAPRFYINNNTFTSFTGNGVVVTQPTSVDAGVSVIANNAMGGNAGNAHILWHRGSGLRIHNNRLLGGANYGIYLDFDNTFSDDGAMLISQNMIELQELYGIYMKREAAAATAGTHIGQITIIGNHFQALSVNNLNSIAIESSTPSGWVLGATITGNVIQSSSDTLLNNAVIRIDDGNGITVTGNTIYNIGATGGGLRAGPNSTNVIFANNNNIGAAASVRYPATQTTTTIIDLTGLPFANIPTAKNGSQIYITDGTQGTPITGAGSGALANRINGAWNGLAGTTATPTTAAVNQFFNVLNTNGTFGSAQPSFPGISGSVACSQMPALTGNVTTSAGACATIIGAAQVANSMLVNPATTVNSQTCTLGSTCTVPIIVSSFLKAATYDLTTASGTQALTGFGFRPSTCTVTGAVGSALQYITYTGMADSAKNQFGTFSIGGTVSGQAKFITVTDSGGTNSQAGTLSSYDADGITITWAKTGTPTGTFNYAVLCYK